MRGATPTRLRKLAALEAACQDAEHLQAHLQHDIATRLAAWEPPALAPGLLDGTPVRVTLKPLRATHHGTRDAFKHWGIPPVLDNPECLVHVRDAGWGVFTLPDLIDISIYAGTEHKKRKNYRTAVAALATLAVFSQHTLSEAATLTRDLLSRDEPDHWVKDHRAEVASLLMVIVTVWEVRKASGEGLGDETAVARGVHQVKHMLDESAVNELRAQLDAALARVDGSAAS